MSEYKLTYFDGQGKAEIIRLIFAAAGVDYEDVRIPREKWPEVKPTLGLPMGQVPILEYQGHKLFQSLAISRFLAKKFGLAGKTEWEEVKVDIVVDSADDVLKPVIQFFRLEKDEKKKEELRNAYIRETLPNFLKNLENVLKSQNNGDGFFVGDSLTWADLQILVLCSRLELMVKLTNPFGEYPKLKGLVERVSAVPKVAAWLAKRPKTSF